MCQTAVSAHDSAALPDLAAVLAVLPDRAAWLDGLGRIVVANPAWRQAGDGEPGGDLAGLWQGQAGQDGSQLAAGLQSVLSGQLPLFELGCQRQDGDERRWDHCRMVPLAGGVLVTHTDITVHKLAEEAAADDVALIRLIADAVPALVSYTDKNRILRFVNQSYERWYNISAADIIGQHLADLLGEAAYAKAKANVDLVLSGREVTFESQTSTGDRWFHATLVPHVSKSGMVLGYFTLVYDVTQAKATEAMLATQKQQIEGQYKAKSEFLAGMSHELRTPLNAIIGFSEVLMAEIWGPLGHEKYSEYARDIHNSGQYLLEMINDVLDLSKLEAGKFELREENIHLGDVVDACVRMLGDKARAANISLSQEIDVRVPKLQADTRLSKQVLLNLLSNAIKFTPSGGKVTAIVEQRPDGRIAMAVRDTGIGIESKNIPLVLEPFGQVDSKQGRLHSHESTGLGLPLTKRFMELHGGTLMMESEPGKGTVVTALYPAGRVVAG